MGSMESRENRYAPVQKGLTNSNKYDKKSAKTGASSDTDDDVFFGIEDNNTNRRRQKQKDPNPFTPKKTHGGPKQKKKHSLSEKKKVAMETSELDSILNERKSGTESKEQSRKQSTKIGESKKKKQPHQKVEVVKNLPKVAIEKENDKSIYSDHERVVMVTDSTSSMQATLADTELSIEQDGNKTTTSKNDIPRSPLSKNVNNFMPSPKKRSKNKKFVGVLTPTSQNEKNSRNGRGRPSSLKTDKRHKIRNKKANAASIIKSPKKRSKNINSPRNEDFTL